MERSLPHRWLDCTPIFSQAAFGKDYLVRNVWFCGNQLLSSFGFNFSHLDMPTTRKNKYVKGKNKFPGADRVVYSLAYLQGLPENSDKEYSLCYNDRYLGLLEMPVRTFVEKGEVPLHRIQIFKCNGQIIWHRKTKFTSIS